MRRRDFIKVVAGSAAAWPLAGHAQQPVLPVVGFVRDGSAEASARLAAAFRKGLNETGYIEGQNVTVEYHWLQGQYERLPALMADLVRRQVAVIAAPGFVPAQRLKLQQQRSRSFSVSAMTRSSLALSPASHSPAGNATGINFSPSR